MKAIDKLREEGRAREKDMEKNFSSCLPFPSSSLTCQSLPLESFFFLLTLSVSTSKLFALQNTGALPAKKVQVSHFIFFLSS